LKPYIKGKAMHILETSRLFLKQMVSDDFLALYQDIFSNKNVVKETFGSQLFTQEQTYHFLEEQGNFSDTLGLSTLWEKQNEDIIGLAGVLRCDYLEEEDYEIGFILKQEAWGKGYAQEIGQAQIEMIRSLGKKRALAVVAPNNLASINALKKLHFSDTQIRRQTNRGERCVYVLDF
jgi:RimJ/RimL family protein N-acetyltransferase